MKKVVFCLQTMVLGGVEKELITVLRKIHTQYDITVLLLYLEDAQMLKDIPSDVKIRVIGIDKEYYCGSAAELIKQRIRKGKLFEAASIGVKRCLKIGMSPSNTDISDIPSPAENYDTAICYHIHSPLMMRYVAEKVCASRKVGWIHTDFYSSGYPVQRLREYVVLYDEFVAVSNKVENEFRALCPWYRGGISTAHNYLDADEIIQNAQEPITENIFRHEYGTKLLTVGRFTKEKGIDLAIKAAAMLKQDNLKFHWFLIGYGELESTYRKLIAEYGVEDCFTILGRKANPYPYLKNCDIYVQPSRHEAFGLVVLEAKILQKPIVCTDFDGADEQIDHGKNGMIVPILDVSALVQTVGTLIRCPEQRNNLVRELKKWTPEDDLREIIRHFE